MNNRKKIVLMTAAVLAMLLFFCAEPFPGSSSAASDLTGAMEAIHGAPYTGRVLSAQDENGQEISLREDLAYSIDTAQPLVLRSWLAAPLGVHRKYVCQAVLTRSRVDESGAVLETARQVWTYTGLDDCERNSTRRAWLETEDVTYPDGEALFDLTPIP